MKKNITYHIFLPMRSVEWRLFDHHIRRIESERLFQIQVIEVHELWLKKAFGIVGVKDVRSVILCSIRSEYTGGETDSYSPLDDLI